MANDTTRERSRWSALTAAQIRAERAALGVTLVEFAELTGISVTTVRRLEKGIRVADATQLARVCAAIQISLSEFFRRVEARYLSTYPPGTNGDDV